MNVRNRNQKLLAFCLNILLINACWMMSAKAQTRQTGDLVSSGDVTINGQPAASGATVFSDSTIATGANGSAVIRLGGLGQAELSPNSSLKLSFDQSGLKTTLISGQARVSNVPAGTSAIISTKDVSAAAAAADDSGQVNAFTASIDSECGVTRVTVHKGTVSLRGENGAERRLAAGNEATLGQPAPGTSCSSVASDTLSFTKEATVVLILGSALAAALIVGAAVGEGEEGRQVVSSMR